MRSLELALIQYDWCPREKRLGHRQTQREAHVRTQGGGGTIQAKERGLRRDQHC